MHSIAVKKERVMLQLPGFTEIAEDGVICLAMLSRDAMCLFWKMRG